MQGSAVAAPEVALRLGYGSILLGKVAGVSGAPACSLLTLLQDMAAACLICCSAVQGVQVDVFAPVAATSWGCQCHCNRAAFLTMRSCFLCMPYAMHSLSTELHSFVHTYHTFK